MTGLKLRGSSANLGQNGRQGLPALGCPFPGLALLAAWTSATFALEPSHVALSLEQQQRHPQVASRILLGRGGLL